LPRASARRAGCATSACPWKAVDICGIVPSMNLRERSSFRRPDEVMMYTHILVPTDGSEVAQKGVDHALSLAKALGSKVTVITVTEAFPIIYGREWQPGPIEAKR